VVRVLEQSATVIKAEVSSTSSDSMAAGFLGVELTYQLTRSPAHAYGQSRQALLSWSCSYPQKHDRNGTIRVGSAIYHLSTYKQIYSIENPLAISTTYGVLKSNLFFLLKPLTSWTSQDVALRITIDKRTCSACGGGPFRENQGTKHKRGDSSTI
jgi:hypothetical protein